MEILVFDVPLNLQKYLGRSTACFSRGDRSRDGCQSGVRRLHEHGARRPRWRLAPHQGRLAPRQSNNAGLPTCVVC